MDDWSGDKDDYEKIISQFNQLVFTHSTIIKLIEKMGKYDWGFGSSLIRTCKNKEKKKKMEAYYLSVSDVDD